MSRRDRFLYHQLHPAKLAVDWAFGLVSLVPFWNHQPVLGITLAIVPSAIVSYTLLTHADLAAFKQSSIGVYMARHASTWLETGRIAGFFGMVMGAWMHDVVLIGAGLSLILLMWLHDDFHNRVQRAVRSMRFKSLHKRVPANLPR